MIDYSCPQCNNIMQYVREGNFYHCHNCLITYFDKLKNHADNNKLWIKGKFFAEGTFEYCCRVYKLKAFS